MHSMNSLTILADPSTRGCLLREVRALCAGDLFPACDVEGVRGADLGTLTLVLRRPDTGAMLATASAFTAVPGAPSTARTHLNLSTEPLAAWYAEVLEESDAEDRIESSAFSVLARLEVSDAIRTWVECDVPLILRALTSDVVAGADGVSPRAVVARTPTGARVTVTDRWGVTSAEVFDGAPGAPGADGVSPTVDIADVDGGVQLSFTDVAHGTQTRTIRHGRGLSALPASMRIGTVSELFAAVRTLAAAAGVAVTEEEGE